MNWDFQNEITSLLQLNATGERTIFELVDDPARLLPQLTYYCKIIRLGNTFVEPRYSHIALDEYLNVSEKCPQTGHTSWPTQTNVDWRKDLHYPKSDVQKLLWPTSTDIVQRELRADQTWTNRQHGWTNVR